MKSTSPVMLIRLPNHVGDVVLALPAIEEIERSGFQPQLLGKAWVHDLLSPYLARGWALHTYPASFRARVQFLARLRRELKPRLAIASTIEALVLPNSFSSALELRLAGWRACGYAGDGRSGLLQRRVTEKNSVREYERFFAIAQTALGAADSTIEAPIPQYGVPNVLAQQVSVLLHGAVPGDTPRERLIVLCPFAAGKISGRSKEWPHFPALAQQLLRRGYQLVLCPGGREEEARARSEYPGCVILAQLGLAQYAALLSLVGLVVANDTGPGHLAAAVNANLLSIRGPDSAPKYHPVGPKVKLAQSVGQWPSLSAVEALL